MKQWEKAYENYMIEGSEPDEVLFHQLMGAVSKYMFQVRANREFYDHPLFRKTIVEMGFKHEEELKEFFEAGWKAHQRHMKNAVFKRVKPVK